MHKTKLSKRSYPTKVVIRTSLVREILTVSIARWSTFVIVFAAMGAMLLLATHAATNPNVFSASPQSGTLTAPASLVSDSTAVGQQAVRFGTIPSCGGGTQAGCTSGSTIAPCICSATTAASGWGAPVFDDEFDSTTAQSFARPS